MELALVSSRRPEVEGTERSRSEWWTESGSGFHRVDPRLRVLKDFKGAADEVNQSCFIA